MRPRVLLLAALLFTGCGGAKPTTAEAPKPTEPEHLPSPSSEPKATGPAKPPAERVVRKKTLAEWLAVLQGEQTSDEDRGSAADAIGEFGPAASAAAGPLGTLLKHKRSFVRDPALDSLVKLGPGAKDAVPQLIELLKEKPEVRLKAIQCLENVGPPATAALDPLAAEVKDKDLKVRSAALHAIIVIDPNAKAKPTLPTLLEALKDKTIGDQAVNALVKMGEPAVAPLVATLKSADPEANARAAVALGRLGSKAAVDQLAAALLDTDVKVRRRSAEALAKIGAEAKPAVNVLLDRLRDEDDGNVRGNVKNTLLAIGPDASMTARLIVMIEEKKNGAREASILLAKIGTPAVAELVRLLSKTDVAILSEAIIAVGQIGPDAKTAVPKLIVLLEDEDDGVVKAARVALLKIDPQEAAKRGIK